MGKISQFHNDENKNENISEKTLQERYDKYKNMDASQLSNELISEVGRQKMEGSFDYKKLENAVESLRGNLSEENYKNIKKILEGLKWF